jgi:hypothetical protein
MVPLKVASRKGFGWQREVRKLVRRPCDLRLKELPRRNTAHPGLWEFREVEQARLGLLEDLPITERRLKFHFGDSRTRREPTTALSGLWS